MKPWWQSYRTNLIVFAIGAAISWLEVFTKPIQPWSTLAAITCSVGAVVAYFRWRGEVREVDGA